MNYIQVSLIASSNRPQLYRDIFESLKNTTVNYEIIFAGNVIPINQDNVFLAQLAIDGIFKYVLTENIKPAQCYEIARRNAIGETICWVADDCEFPDDVIGKAYKYWKDKNDETLILSIQTKESGYGSIETKLFNMDNHRFFGYRKDTPLMAPLGLMSREFLSFLGGFDRRYICGQYENDVVMRAYQKSAKVEIFGDKNCFIDIDHLGKSIRIGESTSKIDFLRRPFATGYHSDRAVLEGSWEVNGMEFQRKDEFEPYEDKDLLTKSQSNKGKWE